MIGIREDTAAFPEQKLTLSEAQKRFDEKMKARRDSNNKFKITDEEDSQERTVRDQIGDNRLSTIDI